MDDGPSLTIGARPAAARRGRWLQQHLAIAWNSAECLVALAAGCVAGSIALVGLGVRPGDRGHGEPGGRGAARPGPHEARRERRVVMPGLAWLKRRVAADLSSGALKAESRQTEFGAGLSGILLLGLGLNAALGRWWADPVGALALAPFIAREGVEAAWRRTGGAE